MINAEFMRAVCELNKQAQVVLEFGLQTIHSKEQRLIERPTNLRKVTQAITACIEQGITVEVSLIFGLPEQTLDSFQKSIDYCMALNIPTIHAFP
ncbi:MAG: radical domain protein, partial [Gammaproteobacteria bacterium]|nr:radical domain protein [Gammaproteobacteria bacterium]